MNLIITDHADESVGLFPESYTIGAPVSQDDDPEDIELFRKLAVETYAQFACGNVSAIYDFELDQIEEQINLSVIDWNEAEKHLIEIHDACVQIGAPGLFALVSVINPLKFRFTKGERTTELYKEIMKLR